MQPNVHIWIVGSESPALCNEPYPNILVVPDWAAKMPPERVCPRCLAGWTVIHEQLPKPEARALAAARC